MNTKRWIGVLAAASFMAVAATSAHAQTVVEPYSPQDFRGQQQWRQQQFDSGNSVRDFDGRQSGQPYLVRPYYEQYDSRGRQWQDPSGFGTQGLDQRGYGTQGFDQGFGAPSRQRQYGQEQFDPSGGQFQQRGSLGSGTQQGRMGSGAGGGQTGGSSGGAGGGSGGGSSR